MKLPNGYGGISKLNGKRRRPYVAKITKGWVIDETTGNAKQIQQTIGYYASKKEALEAIVSYNQNPYDIATESITFKEVYDKWSEGHFETIVPSAIRTWKSAYNYCGPIHAMRFKDIRANHLEGCIKNADVGDSTKARMKSLFNMLYRYALKHDIVNTDYSALCDSVKKGKPTIERMPFLDDEIELLKQNLTFPFVDMVLIGIYSGWRPQELATLKVEDIDIKNMTMKGGLKTDAGRNRLVPIHPGIKDLIVDRLDEATALGSEYLFNDMTGQQGTYMTYDKYRGRWNKIMNFLGLKHRPHDTRHTFITLAKNYDVNEYVLKLIVGHTITDLTENTYTHRGIEQLTAEIGKIKY